MADQEQQAHTTFPNPPAYFWKNFTPERIARMQQLRKEYSESTGVGAPLRLPNLPEDLINLQPPAEPADGSWRVFGSRYTLRDELPSLEEQQIQRLIPPPPQAEDPTEPQHADRALELKRLAKSLLLNFLELVGVLATRPQDADEKLADIKTLFMNMEHAMNEYRPHQAREQAIALLQEHLDRTRAETAAVRAVTDKARRVLEGLGSIEVPDLQELVGGGGGKSSEEEAVAEREALRRERERGAWAAMDSAFV